MVTRILALLHREVSGLHEAAFLLALFAFGAKLLAIVRDRFLASTFGASLDLDIYYAAFRIPDFIYVTLSSLVASAVLIPFILSRIHDEERVRQFFNGVFTLFLAAVFGGCFFAFIGMEQLAGFVVPGLDEASHESSK